MFKILRFIKKYNAKAIIGLVFKLLAAILELCIPMIMAQIVNNMAIFGAGKVVAYCGIIILIVFVNVTLDMVCQRFSATCAAGIGQELRQALYSKIGQLSYPEIDALGAGSLITRTTSDVTQVQTSVNLGIRLLSRAPFMAIGAMVMAAIIDLWMSLIFLGVIILVFIAAMLIRKFTVPMFRATQKRLDSVTVEVKENLEGARVSRAFNMQAAKTEDFTEIATSYKRTVMRVNSISALLSPITFLIINFAIFGVVWLGGLLVSGGKMLSGDILALVSYLTQVLIALTIITNLIVVFTRADASASRIEEVLASQTKIIDPIGGAIKPCFNNDSNVSGNTDICGANANAILADNASACSIIEFRNVSFRYDEASRDSLQGITFAIKAGERIGIIGGTGQGKTTLINLIPRYYEASSGDIIVGGVNIRDWSLAALQKYVTIAPQKVALLSGTIGENIGIGNQSATTTELAEAANIAAAAEFIDKLDNGYDHIVEQEGRNYSGGQRQRISLARAFARQSEILIIDDSLSALDLITDQKVRDNINANFADRTIIIVSQRLSTLIDCDRILLMEHGAITAMGSHNELLASSALYKEIYMSQSGR